MEDYSENTMHLNMDSGDFEATPENTSLFQFMGHLSCYDHVFIVTNEEKSAGTYVFSTHPVFEKMVAFMVNHAYPVHLNLRDVAECDLDAFNKMIGQQADDLDGGVPEEWTHGRTE